MSDLIRLPEPILLFGHDQGMEDPRDGLTLFGTFERGSAYAIRAGVIGTSEGIRRYKQWVARIQTPIMDLDKEGGPQIHRPMYPGFEAAFGIPWEVKPVLEITIPDGELEKHLYLDDKHMRVYETVEVYSERILRAKRQEEVTPDIWFVIVPELLWKKCRPKSFVEKDLRITAEGKMPARRAKSLYSQPSLMPDENVLAVPYHFEVHFHNQLKARLLKDQIVTQIIRETTLAPDEFVDQFGRPQRGVDDPSAIAWNLTTTAFYKAGARPWKIHQVREGVCYIGLVFKQNQLDPRNSCCAAQMFLDSGDGVVFKGAVGPWHTPGKPGEYHLGRHAAKDLIGMALATYRDYFNDPPRELFIHGQIRFNDEEWGGFTDAAAGETNLVGVRIRDENHLKLFTTRKHAVLRGSAYLRDQRTGFLWTKGFIPRLQTYPGRGVPKPLLIDICKGEADLHTVCTDIMALTKLNYNACVFADGKPVTLKFADAVGEILTAGPVGDVPPLPFKHYI
jgi:hypothetical protein